MNEHVRYPTPRPTTQAAEGVPRWRWTTAELIRLTELGAFTAEDCFELIGGEIVPMSPEGRRHRLVADELAQMWGAIRGPDIRVMSEIQLDLADDTYVKPDIWVRPTAIKAPDVRGDTVLLVVEVAVSSLTFDTTTKSKTYAAHGVREYWVIDAQTLETRLFADPRAEGYARSVVALSTQRLAPLLAPQLAVRLADLDI